ncbi:MAG TPA: urate hydroxylase PuuD [Vicinamibacteria bacterium]|nr:urate hydroxylase PuuD [Vicinamibacteria bacterium]
MDILSALFRWIHILAGIVWIGMLYFFNFVNGPFQGTLDGEAKKKVNPELLPRALYWFRWGAAWTWGTGVLLLALVFYHGGIMFDGGGSWGAGGAVMALSVFVAPFLYDALHKSPLGKDPKTFGSAAFVLIAATAALMHYWGGFGYRALNIHLAALLGTIMAFNVWFRIWPAQQTIIKAVKEGTAPDAALVALAGARSRHNVYMSVPLFWGMMNQHTTTVSLPGQAGFATFLVVALVGWHVVWQLYKKAPSVKGF